jgi:hypothetical protein
MKRLVLTSEPITAGQLRDALPSDIDPKEIKDRFGPPVDRATV